jgi:hypothetical protein
MQRHDFAEFRSLLDRCAEVYGKPKPSDALLETYWSSLLDVNIAVVRRCADAHLKHSKFFPKPAELRPKEDKPQAVRDPASDDAFQAAERRAIRNLEELKLADAERWRREVRLRYLDRRMATEREGSAIYAQAKREWLQLRGLA